MIIPVLSVADYLIAYIFVLKYSRDPKDSLGLTHSAPTRRRSDQPRTPVARRPRRPPSVRAVPRGRWAAAPAARRPPRAARRRIAPRPRASPARGRRSEEHTFELQSLMRTSHDVFCLKKKNTSIAILKCSLVTRLHLM